MLTFDRAEVIDGVEIDYTSNELANALAGVLEGNGNFLERLLGRTTFTTSPILEELRPLVRASLSRRVYKHYRGFAASQLRFLERDPIVKKVLYVLRTALTGTYLLETGELETDVTRLLDGHGFSDALALVEAKRAGERTAADPQLLDTWRPRLAAALKRLDGALAQQRSPRRTAECRGSRGVARGDPALASQVSPRPREANEGLRAGLFRGQTRVTHGVRYELRSPVFPPLGAFARSSRRRARRVRRRRRTRVEGARPRRTSLDLRAPPRAAPAPTAPAPIATPPSGKLIGATPYEGGVEFRVWAPNAKAVAVVGEAAGASGRRELTLEAGTGMFAARIDGAHAGQRYHYAITAQDGSEVTRVDPRARMSDGSDSVVVDPRTYAWKSKPFTPPARDASVVYELHVGSFNAATGRRSAGSFTTAVDKLDALVDLGINTVELMPVNGHGGNGWGYGPQQWFAPHAFVRLADDLRHFVDEAHARGIAVVLDVVFNHYDGYNAGAASLLRRHVPRHERGHLLLRAGSVSQDAVGPAPRLLEERGRRLLRRQRLRVDHRVSRRRLPARLGVEHPRPRRPGLRAGRRRRCCGA